MTIFTALVSGLLFGVGLLVSGMANPAKVLGFLDVFGTWDPSLAFVMAGAIAVGLVAFGVARRMTRSLSGEPMRLPATQSIDRRLMAGAVVFGVGWGLAGFCPGPALVALAAGSGKALIFVLAMVAGMVLYEWLETRRKNPSAGVATSVDAVDA
ncbi:YeeE/YedE family protein [Variovorax sp. RTB1]|uniref:YeeE/YedE family protein n=1 Tax=Variovorax sp. RTB1 TaxID=3048631 RepID=UPI002B22A74B|nr:YeeE/YedE family protein [Variovorax sp. RTB1]MEB0114104.1 YeeE/YedE family protein [Variovorax sp. RTB1]